MADKILEWGLPITSINDLPRDSGALGMSLKDIYENKEVFIDYVMNNITSNIRTNGGTPNDYSAIIRGNLVNLFEAFSTAPDNFHLVNNSLFQIGVVRNVTGGRWFCSISIGTNTGYIGTVEEINSEFENSINSCTATISTYTQGTTTINRLSLSNLYTKEIKVDSSQSFDTRFYYDDPQINDPYSYDWSRVDASWNRDSIPYFYSGDPFTYIYNSNTYTYHYFQLGNVSITDRYNPNGTETSTSGKYPSSSMGGQGTFDDSTDLSDISTKPSLNLSNLGFFSVWNPSASDLRSLADYVWNDPANIAQWPQIFRDGIMHPSDYIISLALYPIASSEYTKANATFCMGGIPFNGGVTALGMTINMDKITEQFIDINMGTVDLKEYFGSFLDYAPYSQISLYLPYYGTVQLSMNEVQNADSISVLYRVNILDGSTSIKVHVDRQTSAAQNGSVPLKHVLYEYFTNLKTEIPRTSGASVEQMKMLATVLSATVTAAAPIAGAGVSHLAGGVQGAMAGGGMAGFMAGAQQGIAGVGQAVENGLKMGASAGNKLVNSMPSGGGIQRGNIGGMNNGLLSERRPFLIITRPIQVLPLNYQDMEGYTTSVFTTLGALESGFVQCESVDTTGLDVTASEKEEIVKLLQGGVFI